MADADNCRYSVCRRFLPGLVAVLGSQPARSSSPLVAPLTRPRHGGPDLSRKGRGEEAALRP
jgi:hypothetical protein